MIFVTPFSSKSAFAQELKLQALTEDWPPYNYLENGKVTGIGVEIVNLVLKKANIQADIKIYPWARAYIIATNEPNVLIFTIGRTPEREKLFKWIGKIAPRKMNLFKLKKRHDIIVNSLNDAKKYSIGVVRNSTSHLSLKNLGFESDGKLSIVSKDIQNLKMLFLGRIDLMAGNELALSYMSKNNNYNYSNLERGLLLSDDGHYYFALSNKTDEKIIQLLKNAYTELETTGVLDSIREKYQ